jgi:hypothetical protein
VEEANLSVQVSRLRRLLAGGRDSTQYVETVPKFGYRFVAPVRVSPAPASGFAPPRAPSAHRQPRTQRASSEGANEHLRLTIQLIRLRDGETLWTEAVEGMLREPLGLREQMTEKIDDTVDRLKTARRRGSGSL